MVGSIDLLDFSPELTVTEERNAIPINCWKEVCLSDIWIPSSLLPSRKEPSNTRITKGIYHTLKKKDSSKCIESFSVYSEEEIFLSDSDEDIFNSCEDAKHCTKNTLSVSTESCHANRNYNERDITENSNQEYRNKQNGFLDTRRFANMKSMPSVDNLCSITSESPSKKIHSSEKLNFRTEQAKENIFNQEEKRPYSNISLNEILDNTPEINMNDFTDKDYEFMAIQERKLDSNQKKNKKKKASKCIITLDEFLDDYTEADHQNACCNDYFNKLLRQKNTTDTVQIKSTAEFPDLAPKELKFINSEKTEAKNPEASLKSLGEILSHSVEIDKDASVDNKEAIPAIPENVTRGKLVIENIPNDNEEDYIHSFLCMYGEIINFSLQPDGDFLKASVEIDLTNDIDWIIECLNGTEAFGASSKVLKCYKQQ